MDERDIMIASLRKQLQELHSKFNAVEDENALLNNEVERLNRIIKHGKSAELHLKTVRNEK